MIHARTPPAGSLVLTGARVVVPDGVIDGGTVEIVDGTIAAVGRGHPRDDARERLDLDGAWLLPGFVDLHMHGGGGHDVADSQQAMAGAVAFHNRHGTTSTLVSLMTAPVAQLVEQLGWIAQLTATPTDAGRVLGAHLEGPFLAPARCGAQDPAHMLAPQPELTERLLAAAGGTLRVLTLAPELPGALAVIERLRRAGVTVALGHSDATYEQAMAAVQAGATLATHLFNGMAALHHRQPGLAGAALRAGIACELINDGIHVHPSIVGIVSRCSPAPVLITDAIAAAGSGEGMLELGGRRVEVSAGAARLASTGALAGSTLTMDQALRRAVLESGLDLPAASRASSGNPARVLGLEGRIGAIEAGLAADLVVLDDQLELVAVMLAGRWLRAPEAFSGR